MYIYDVLLMFKDGGVDDHMHTLIKHSNLPLEYWVDLPEFLGCSGQPVS